MLQETPENSLDCNRPVVTS